MLCMSLLAGCGGASDVSDLLNQGEANVTLVINRATDAGGSVSADVGALSCPTDCDETYPVDTSVTLTATADTGYTFTGWSGTGVTCGSSASCTLTLTESLTVTVTFSRDANTQRDLSVAVTGTGTVGSAPSGISCPADCAGSFADGTSVTLTAVSGSGFKFSSWSGAGCSGSTPTCTVAMTASRSVTATFVAVPPVTQALTVTLSGSGTVASSPAGITCTNDCSAPFTQGSTVTLGASPASGYQFTGWTGACSGTGACAVVMSVARSVGATFTPVAPNTVALNVVLNGSGAVTSTPAGIDCGSICSASFTSGASVKLTAVPASGYTFTGWTGSGCSGIAACTVVLSSATSVAATFTQVKYTLSVSKIGSGTVTSDVGGINCGTACSASFTPTTRVVLTAAPSAGYAFTGWSGSACSGTGTCAITMAAATSVTATFTQVTYVLAVSLNGSGSITSSPAGISCGSACSASFTSGASVTLSASPASGYVFSGWTGACTGTGACTVAMTAARSVSAGFATVATSTYSLDVAITGSGTVLSSPAGVSCTSTCRATFNANTAVTLTATPASGLDFSGWSGACAGTAICTVTLSAATSVTAIFTDPASPIGMGTATPQTAHPRLWLSDPVTLSRLTAAAKANSIEWAALKGFCDANTTPSWDYQGSEYLHHIANFALCYRVTMAASGASAAAPYAAKALTLLKSAQVLGFTTYSTDSGYGIRNYVPAMALGLDWLYDYAPLDASTKSSLIARINAWLNWYASNGYCSFDTSNCSPSVITNYNSGYVLSQVLAGIALYGDDASGAAIWTKGMALYNSARTTFDARMPGGSWPEGWNYGGGVYERYSMIASGLKTGTGDAGYTNFQWLSNNATFKRNALSPDAKFVYDDGMWSGNAVGVPSSNDMVLAGYLAGWASANGKLAKNYIDQVKATAPLTGIEEWKRFAFYDPSAVAADLSGATKSYWAKGTGVVTMRSDWASAAGTWGSFVSGPYLSAEGEQSMDQGHIEVYNGAPLLINAGVALYGTPQQQSTVFENTYTLEGRSDISYSGQQGVTGTCPNPNGNNPIGINAHLDGGSYVFTTGEFSAAYQDPTQANNSSTGCAKPPVNWLSRSTLYVRPGLFVVYDQIVKASSQTNMSPTMHLHFPTKPTAQSTDNRRITVDNGPGRLFVASVLPAAGTANVVSETINANTGPGVSSYHFSLAPSSVAPSYVNFLTVLRAGQSTAAYTAPTVTLISGTSAYGSDISGLLASEATSGIVTVFADNGTLAPPTSLQYQHPARPGSTHYVALLKSNTTYGVTYSSASGTYSVSVSVGTSGTLSLKTDSAGVLRFTE